MISVKDFAEKHYFTLLLVLVILFALILRYFHTKAGLPYLYYWDEPQIASNALKMLKTGDLNPHFFNYGSMMIYSDLVVDILHYLSLMGHPVTAPTYLADLNEIKINADTGWYWTISHPSFYYWNRILTAVLGTGTVFVTYLIGKQIFNRWIGLIAASFLAILPYHIIYSAIIGTDVPVAFFVLLVVLFSVLFVKHKKPSYLILSLIFSGISIATKYNAAITILVPLFALIIVYIRSKEFVKTYMWFLVPTIPVAVFLIIMPYAVIDMTHFLKDVGYEVRHYKVLGEDGASSIPGWHHLKFQLHQFYHQVGMPNTVLILLGLGGLFLRPLFLFVLMLPAVYILYMTGMKVNFHRNFIQVYPFIALLFASGIYMLYYFMALLQKRGAFGGRKRLPIFIVSVIASLLLLPNAYSSFRDASHERHSQDNRTAIVDTINAIPNVKKILIAKELRMHSYDLRRLKKPYTILPLLGISARLSEKGTLYVLPNHISTFYSYRNKGRADRMQAFLDKIDTSNIIARSSSGNDTSIDILSVNPEIMVAKDLPPAPIKADFDKKFNIDFSMCSMPASFQGNPLIMGMPGSVESPDYHFKKGDYALVIKARGTKAFGEYAKLKLAIFAIEDDRKSLIAEKTIETTPNDADYRLDFELQDDRNISISVSFVNDAVNVELGEDRNVVLSSIAVRRKNNR